MAEELADMITLAGIQAGLVQTNPGAVNLARNGAPDGTFCPRCAAVRRMHIIDLHWEGRHLEGRRQPDGPVPLFTTDQQVLPAVFALLCVQCHSTIIVLVHVGPTGVEVVAVPSAYGGVST